MTRSFKAKNCTISEAPHSHMKSSDHHGIVKINITTRTYKEDNRTRDKMERHTCRNNQNTKFICSICLNTKLNDEEKNLECNKRKSKSCPICQKSCDVSVNNTNEKTRRDKTNCKRLDEISTKHIQTSRTDITQGLNLLNEVLTVFQSKKQLFIQKEKNGKTIIVKDASISTDNVNIYKPRLTVSKLFQFSINEGNTSNNGMFSIINSCQPELNNSQNSIDLIKHKSSSIPQMKMDELKNSLKEKAKSKDAIEEVNRMFATVKRDDRNEKGNRPMIRNGPRVLPVVKTNTFCEPTQNKSDEIISDRSESRPSCKCCETNFYLSSGDSLGKQECCHQKCDDDKCEKTYVMCSHYSNHRREIQKHVPICERCRNMQDDGSNQCCGYM